MGAFSGPETVDDGLVLGLDAANTRSYVGSGTTWTDLIGSNNGTLTNGPVFTQEPKLEPFGGAGAVQFDGTGDTLTLANNADHQFGSSDYTIEAWVYLNNLSSVQGLFGRYNTSSAREIYITLNTDGSITHRTSSNGTSFSTHTSSTGLLTAQTWHHVAISKSGTNSYIAVDGVVGSGTVDSTLHTASQTTYIGDAVAGSNLLNGNLSNYRILKGTALYTSNFTPPAEPLTAVTNTELLTCQGQGIKDASSNAHTITVNGDAEATIVSSAFEFDGSDDELNFTNIDVGTGDFTYEAWVYPTASVNQPIIVWHNSTSKVHTFGIWASGQGVDAIFSANARPGSSNSFEVTSAISLNTWHHIAFVRASGTLKVYVDGTEKSLSAGPGSIGGDPSSYSTDVSYVGTSAVDENFKGKISAVKIYKGKGLTAAEVERNFNALRRRYGI